MANCNSPPARSRATPEGVAKLPRLDLTTPGPKRPNWPDGDEKATGKTPKGLAPVVAKAVLHDAGDTRTLALEGANLATAASTGAFPAATLNGTPVHVVGASSSEVRLALPPGLLRDGGNTLRVALDPYAVVTMDVQA